MFLDLRPLPQSSVCIAPAIVTSAFSLILLLPCLYDYVEPIDNPR